MSNNDVVMGETATLIRIRIFIKTCDGKIVPLNVKKTETIKAIKSLLKTEEGIELIEGSQFFVFNGKRLDNQDDTLEGYNIQNGSTIIVGEIEDDLVVSIKSSDGVVFSEPLGIMKAGKAIKRSFIGMDKPSEPMPYNMFEGYYFEQMISYFKHYDGIPPHVDVRFPTVNITEWEEKFLSQFIVGKNIIKLLEFKYFSEYIECEALLHLICKKIAFILKDIKVDEEHPEQCEEMYELFGITERFTAEELKEAENDPNYMTEEMLRNIKSY